MRQGVSLGCVKETLNDCSVQHKNITRIIILTVSNLGDKISFRISFLYFTSISPSRKQKLVKGCYDELTSKCKTLFLLLKIVNRMKEPNGLITLIMSITLLLLLSNYN
jgi:hypothetical protein